MSAQNTEQKATFVKRTQAQRSDETIRMGFYQFRPFSFQESLESIQSVTQEQELEDVKAATLAAFSLKQSVSERLQGLAEKNNLSYDTASSIKVLTSRGETMVDLSGYKDLTKAPEEGASAATVLEAASSEEMNTEYAAMTSPTSSITSSSYNAHPEINEADIEIYAEYSGNVKTLVQLVNDLPEGVTKQTGAQIIRLTMEAMGISMENVLSDAQAVQSELLDVVRSNIKKIEEYKTVIRKLETEIRFHQGKANELSEIIDLFILSNTSPNMPHLDRSESDY